jgi:hypothetical protein
MDIIIKIENGQPIGHPILLENFKQAFLEIDVNNLSDGWARFERVPQTEFPSVYEVESLSYEWDGDIVKDVWTIRPMTNSEKNDLITQVLAQEHPENWIFNEILCAWIPPDITDWQREILELAKSKM